MAILPSRGVFVDKDGVRKAQRVRAIQAMGLGMRRARRKISAGACDECRALDGQIVDIWDVIEGKADHPNGHCTFTFLC